MEILEPKVELWEEKDEISHVARCARVCYGKESGDDKHLYEALKKKKHNSMFRHSTCYYIVPKFNTIINNILTNYYNIIFCNNIIPIGIDIKCSDTKWYIILNGHFILEHDYICRLLQEFEIGKDYFANTEIGFSMMRYTFAVTTQISTSRELNRVSPNNIAEQSTRYVYENGAIVRPHWITDEDIKLFKSDKQLDYADTPAQSYLSNCECQFNVYKNLIYDGVPKENARGILPLDAATKVVYTYSVDEWRNIINLRYFGTTGKPQPNAKIIAGMIKDKLEELGYKFNEIDIYNNKSKNINLGYNN